MYLPNNNETRTVCSACTSNCFSKSSFKFSAEQTVRVSLLLGKYIQDNQLVADAARVNERLMNMLMPYAMRDQALFRQLLDSPMPKQIAQDEVLEEVAIEHIAQTVATPVEKTFSLEELLALPAA